MQSWRRSGKFGPVPGRVQRAGDSRPSVPSPYGRPLAPPAPASAAVLSDLVSPAFPSATAGPSAQASTVQLPEQPIQYYTMSRTIRTVPDLWREWTRGFSADQPSIQSLEDAYGARWRPEQKGRPFFSRRKVIIDYIRRRTALGGNACSKIPATFPVLSYPLSSLNKKETSVVACSKKYLPTHVVHSLRSGQVSCIPLRDPRRHPLSPLKISRRHSP
jgi:Transcriptional activator of glycolytic enzymes